MVIVTLMEPMQNDFIVSLVHHCITIVMLVGSYSLGHLRVAHAILVEQDLGDIILPGAKLCNYLAQGNHRAKDFCQGCADALFAIFAVTWMITRHGILPWIYWAIWHDALPRMQEAGCACGKGKECVWAPEHGCLISLDNSGVYWGDVLTVYKGFLGLFQLLLLIWLRDIVSAVLKVIKGEGVKDAERDTSQGLVCETAIKAIDDS